MHLLCCYMLEEEQKTALCSTLSEILESACSSPSTGFCLVTWAKGQSPHTTTQTQSQMQDMAAPESSQPPQEQQPSESYICHIQAHLSDKPRLYHLKKKKKKKKIVRFNDELLDSV